ncbi:2-amino-4-hydroxy-6-hydroxymethyldihydropteridine diphosphokinase [Candidatus Omnitrophota bacterium]
MATVYLGIGSNIGDKEFNCAEALEQLSKSENVKMLDRSQLYVTEPVGGPPQENYLNGVVKIETERPPEDLLECAKDIEKNMGREDSEVRNSPRVIDIDILLYDDKVIISEDLTIPHPDMHKRSFVLEGLSEIAPEVVHPALGRTIKELYSEL